VHGLGEDGDVEMLGDSIRQLYWKRISSAVVSGERFK
jgi:hypothetical protein